MRYANQAVDRMSADEIREMQQRLLLRQIRYCYDNSDFYRQRFAEVGVEPGDIRSLDDFYRMPILMDKEQERLSQARSLREEGHAFGAHLCSSPEDIAITATTSGTTGLPTFSYTLGSDDLTRLHAPAALMVGQAGIGRGDRVLFAHALGVYATSTLLPPLRAAGVLPIDVDVRGGAESILRFAAMTRPAAAMMTPSLALHLIDRIPEVLGHAPRDLGLRALFVVGEVGAGIPEVKHRIEEAYGCRLYDWIGPFAQALGVSCDSDEYHGMHVVTPDTDLYPMDLIDPETREHVPVVDGAIGEAVYTSLQRKTLPILRYASGDVVRVNTAPCGACGFTGPRVTVVGRSDDMLIVKGVNVYPAAIKRVVSAFDLELTGELRVVLDRPPPLVEPPLTLRLEVNAEAWERRGTEGLSGLERRVQRALHEELRITPRIEWVQQGGLPRALAKTALFEKRYTD
ncbi:phenylacetate-CoA ligase [Leucobacter komagatae]|uniref:Phenylacetate-CoA ligase n=1 Tax=Leucobacter komagatae TaxID=55969 RepID=A0A542Y8U9_9MICO|nr:phenylacetate--CoA ligase [Leucobacter komagatae]TQL44510.1 phenylacetate-CoA ligase [Leucobacter komagatae]